MSKLNNRTILGAKLHTGTNLFIDGVNIGLDLITPAKKALGDKIVNIEILPSCISVTLANNTKSKNAALIPLSNVMYIDLGPEEKQEAKK